MTLWVSPYELKFNLQSGWQDRHGVLLKFEFEDGLEGHADLHPWTELGDPSIETILNDLKQARPSWSMARRCLDLARKDAVARAEKRFLGEGAEQILSHKLIPRLSGRDRVDFEKARNLGYSHFKIKMSQVLGEEDRAWRSLAQEWADSVVWRLDLNSRPSEQQFLEWLGNLPKEVKSQIDFIEDPCSYSGSVWNSIHDIELACDRVIDLSSSEPHLIHAQVMVVKPELIDGLELVRRDQGHPRRYIVTNNLGHPYSFAVARAEASELYGHYPQLREVCGLQGLEYYEQSSWTERFKLDGPRVIWNWCSDSGYGFDELLKELTWKKL